MLLTFLFVFLFGSIVAVVFSFNALYNTLKQGLPYVSTPRWAIEWLHDHLELTDHDVVYELGCGSATVLVNLARKYPETSFVGIEIQWWPYVLAKWRAKNYRNIRLVYGDIFHHDLSPATVVYGFFITGFMAKLETKLAENLRPGTRVISYGFSFPGKTTVSEVTNPNKEHGSKIKIYRW